MNQNDLIVINVTNSKVGKTKNVGNQNLSKNNISRFSGSLTIYTKCFSSNHMFTSIIDFRKKIGYENAFVRKSLFKSNISNVT